MKPKHIQMRIKQCHALAEMSECPRRQFGALLLDPLRNVVLMDGYNGGPRDGGRLCGDTICLREADRIESGTHCEVGCHHAEMNVVCNAAANGVSTGGAWLIVTGEPCLMCAKLIHHAGITRCIIVGDGYPDKRGINYLSTHGIQVEDARHSTGETDND